MKQRLRFRDRSIVDEAIYSGCRVGISRAFFKDDEPDQEALQQECYEAVLEYLEEVIDWSETRMERDDVGEESTVYTIRCNCGIAH